MKYALQHYLNSLFERYSELKLCEDSIIDAYNVLEECFSTGHKLLIAGNGGSCADSEHFVGELMKGFRLRRKCPDSFAKKLEEIDSERGAKIAHTIQGALPAIALDGHQALNTAFINDVSNGGEYIYAQQVYGFGKTGDVFFGISTSGNSKNVFNAAIVAKALGLKVVGLTGNGGGNLGSICDTVIKVPETEPFKVQELHLPVYHCLCLMLEERFFE